MDEFLREKNIRNSKRVSIKRKNDEIDRDRTTYCFGYISDNTAEEIMRFLTDNEEAIKYIKRNKTDDRRFIVSIDKDCVKFYLDFGIAINKVSMISLEIRKSEFKVKLYKGKRLEQFPVCYLPLRPYLDENSHLVRDDGQKYLRFKSQPPPYVFLRYFPNDEDFFRNVREPTWFQFSENSCTFYFESL